MWHFLTLTWDSSHRKVTTETFDNRFFNFFLTVTSTSGVKCAQSVALRNMLWTLQHICYFGPINIDYTRLLCDWCWGIWCIAKYCSCTGQWQVCLFQQSFNATSGETKCSIFVLSASTFFVSSSVLTNSHLRAVHNSYTNWREPNATDVISVVSCIFCVT